MNTSLAWIKAYVPDLTCTDQEYCDAMTLSGTKVEGYERLDKNLEKIVIGQIEKIEKHPDADKLIICQVNVGDQVIQIVTGAPNVKEGDKVPVVLDGGRVAGGHDGGPLPEEGIKIKAGKLRGVPSNGMMCSIEELGSSREMYPEAPENGIYIFPADAQVGADAVEALGLHDTVFEYEITSNRVDCYSLLGIAREAAATFRKPFIAPKVEVKGNEEDVNDYISVEVKDTDLCSRYCARVCKNIKIEPSPIWCFPTAPATMSPISASACRSARRPPAKPLCWTAKWTPPRAGPPCRMPTLTPRMTAAKSTAGSPIRPGSGSAPTPNMSMPFTRPPSWIRSGCIFSMPSARR